MLERMAGPDRPQPVRYGTVPNSMTPAPDGSTYGTAPRPGRSRAVPSPSGRYAPAGGRYGPGGMMSGSYAGAPGTGAESSARFTGEEGTGPAGKPGTGSAEEAGGRRRRRSCRALPAGRPVGLFCGLTVVDVIQLVEAPPGPDDKVVALDQLVAAGGPATNAAVAFAALGGRAILAAPVGAGPLAELVRADLAATGVELIDCSGGPGGSDRSALDLGAPSAGAPEIRGEDAPAAGAGLPAAGAPAPIVPEAPGLSVSSCVITAATGQRSVVSTNARAVAVTAPLDRYAARVDRGRRPPPDVVLIDGHNPALAEVSLDLAARAGALTVMDAGSWKDAAARLPGRCDVVAASARFYPPGPTGSVTAPRDVAHWLLDAGARGVVITRGARPALWWCAGGHDSVSPPQVAAVDTLGAGDVFHGALAHALAGTRRDDLTGPALGAAVERACDVAAASTEVFGTRAWRQRLD